MILFAKNILFLRKRLNLTQAEMPDHIETTRGTWGNYENDVSEPDLQKLVEIAQFFGVPIDYLLSVDIEQNVHLIEKLKAENNGENVHLNVHPNVLETLNEPEVVYEKAKNKQIDLLILKQLNVVADDLKEIKKKLEL